jgi:hypothetical protein
MGRTLDSYLDAQGPARKLTEQTTGASLDLLGLPSRTQVAEVAAAVGDLDDRVDEFEERVASMHARLEDIAGGLADKMAEASSDRLIGVERRIDDLAGKLPSDNSDRLDAIDRRLGEVTDRLEAAPPGSDGGEVDRRLEAIESRLEQLAGRLEQALEAASAPPAPATPAAKRTAGRTAAKEGGTKAPAKTTAKRSTTRKTKEQS